MEIELEETTKKIVEIPNPYYSKSTIYSSHFKFTDEGILTVGDNIIVWQSKHYQQEAYLNSTECTREEVETKFNEVIKNLKNKL